MNNTENNQRTDASQKPSQLVQFLTLMIAVSDGIPVEQVTLEYVQNSLKEAYRKATERAIREGKTIVSSEELRAARDKLFGRIQHTSEIPAENIQTPSAHI